MANIVIKRMKNIKAQLLQQQQLKAFGVINHSFPIYHTIKNEKIGPLSTIEREMTIRRRSRLSAILQVSQYPRYMLVA